jgi:hypothetical protein
MYAAARRASGASAQSRYQPWGAVGLGLGAFALGSVLANPYYFNPYYSPYGYYPPAPAYYPQRRTIRQHGAVGTPIYRYYYAC